MTTLPFNKTDHSGIYSVNLEAGKKPHRGALFSVQAHRWVGNFNSPESTLRL